jgi:hypothetical protein
VLVFLQNEGYPFLLSLSLRIHQHNRVESNAVHSGSRVTDRVESNQVRASPSAQTKNATAMENFNMRVLTRLYGA